MIKIFSILVVNIYNNYNFIKSVEILKIKMKINIINKCYINLQILH